MKGKKLLAGLVAFSMLAACCACGPTGGGDDDQTVTLGEEYTSLPTVQLSSVAAVEESGSCKLKMKAPWTDTYNFSFSNRSVTSVEVYSESGKVLKNSTEQFNLQLDEGTIVYLNIIPVKNAARITVTAKENKSPLPFALGQAPNPDDFETVSADPTVDPLKAAELKYTKRDNTLYVYCNAPEELQVGPQVVNTCITRQEVSDQSVYFTFEQQSNGLSDLPGFTSNGVYYGYRVTNTGEDDLYITVKNIGWQVDGAGAYLGEKEWIDFYNTKFELPDFSDFTESQHKLFTGYYGFSGEYLVHNFQPTTYRIPKGKYMYVMGGTTVDAFGAFNVDNTANRLTTYSTCANGAVLFDVVGKAEGAYYVYNDVSKVMPGGEGYDTHMGITDPEAYGVVHTGEDVGYVVDNQATWTFNDVTPAQQLPVTFTNYYSTNCSKTGTPNTPIPGTEPHVQYANEWRTHIDPQATHETGGCEAVGTDMTAFHTINKDGDRIIVGANYYDTRGMYPNIGNWMKDYQDVFTFVNQGDNEREIAVTLHCTGAVVMLMRDMNGKLMPGTAGYSMAHGDDYVKGKFEKGFNRDYVYTVKIPPHSVKQFVMEYNLMANSFGNVAHSVELK